MNAPAGNNLAGRLALAAAQLKAGAYCDSLATTLAASALPAHAPAEEVELARRLLQFNQSAALRDRVTRLLARPVGNAAAEADVAAMLSMVGEQALASRLLARAMAVLGPHAAHLYNRSQMHLYSGRLAEAESDLRACLAREPTMAKAHWALSKLPKGEHVARDINAARACLARVAPGSQDEAFLRYALFNQLDRTGDTDGAWKELVRGGQVKRALLNYSTPASMRLFEALCAAFPQAAPQRQAAVAQGEGPVPIFIVGMHRSGTTLLERMLGNHSQVSEGGELYDFPAQLRLALGRHFPGPLDLATVEASSRFDWAAIGRGYLEQVRWRAGDRAMLVDKLPSNFLNAGFIHQALPQARIVHMQRQAMDTCFSNFKELFSNACAYSYDLDELADYYAGYRSLMAHWREALPGAVLDVRYEDLARDPETQGKRILDFCGLPWEPACLDVTGNARAVNTASSAQVREPLHQRSIGAWRRYEAQLAPLQARLAAHGFAAENAL
jgi:hypothetical protein